MPGGIKGLKTGYVGRRREVQRLVPSLRHGDATFAVLTGIGGAGKSTLATRAVNRLQATGFGLIPVKVGDERVARSPDEAGRTAANQLLTKLDDAFVKANRLDVHATLTNGDLPTGQRLRLAIDGLNDLKLVVALDNFEDALDLETRRVADPDLAEFYHALARNLVRGSRAIVTCRYLPEGTPVDLPNILHLPLPEFPAHDALKFLRRDKEVDRRIARGELTGDLVDRLYQALGGTPGLLDQVRTLLRKADPNDLLDELGGGVPGLIDEKREAYCAAILTSRLYAALSPPAQALASRLALSLLPIPAEAAAPLADLTEPEATARLDEAVAYGLLQRFDDPEFPSLYHPPGLLRPWLADPDRFAADEARAIHAHLAAFWRSSYEADREQELRVDFLAELEVCREHGGQAGEWVTFAWATAHITTQLLVGSKLDEARKLLDEIPKESRDALTLYNLASIDLNRGDYDDARAGFAQALEIYMSNGDRSGQADTSQQLASIDSRRGNFDAARAAFSRAIEIYRAIGDRAGQAATLQSLASIDLKQGKSDAARDGFARAIEIHRAVGDRFGQAAALHNLASIDLERGEYDAARDGLARAMEIRRDIGDRAGQASTFFELGRLASKVGRSHHAARLQTLCFLIDQSIGHGNTVTDARMVAELCLHLGYDHARFDAMRAEVAAEHGADGGRGLIERAFAEDVDDVPVRKSTRKRPGWLRWLRRLGLKLSG